MSNKMEQIFIEIFLKGSTSLMFSPENIKYELEDLRFEDHMHLRDFLREIVSLWDVFKVGVLSTSAAIPAVILLPFVAI